MTPRTRGGGWADAVLAIRARASAAGMIFSALLLLLRGTESVTREVAAAHLRPHPRTDRRTRRESTGCRARGETARASAARRRFAAAAAALRKLAAAARRRAPQRCPPAASRRRPSG